MPSQTIKVKKKSAFSTKDEYLQTLDEDEHKALSIIKEEFNNVLWIEQTNGYTEYLKEKNK